jgi:hypothetical protein
MKLGIIQCVLCGCGGDYKERDYPIGRKVEVEEVYSTNCTNILCFKCGNDEAKLLTIKYKTSK